MNFLKSINHIFFLVLTFFLWAQTTFAKTELVLPQAQVSFSIEQDQSFSGLEKEVPPNLGFLKEKSKFGLSEGVPAQNTYDFSERVSKDVANAGSDWLVTLKSNSSFKSYFDDLVANPSTRKFANTLSIEEEAVLKFYTTNEGYEFFNIALRGEIPMTDFYTAQKNLMNQALDKLPNYSNQSELWRGLKNLSLDDVKAMYVKDAVVTEKHFMSSAYDVNDFIQSSRQRNFEYIIKVEGKSGKLIEPASTLPEEAEVLFKSDTQFKVEKASYDLHPDDSYLNSQGQPFIWTVVLKEL